MVDERARDSPLSRARERRHGLRSAMSELERALGLRRRPGMSGRPPSVVSSNVSRPLSSDMSPTPSRTAAYSRT